MSDDGFGSGAVFTGLILVASTVYLLWKGEIQAALVTLALLVVLALGFYFIIVRYMGEVAKINSEHMMNADEE